MCVLIWTVVSYLTVVSSGEILPQTKENFTVGERDDFNESKSNASFKI